MKTFLLSVQHLLAMYAGAILVPIIVGTSLKFSPEEIAFLVTVDIFMCGVATLLQVWKGTGTGLPIVLGCTFTAVAPMILIGQTKGLGVLYGSLFLAGILVVIIAPFFSHLVKYFPPVVTGSVVTIIGINLMPVAMNYMAGGEDAKDYGDGKNILLGLATLVIILVLQRFTTGFMNSIAILIGLIMGTILASFVGVVDVNQVGDAKWFALPQPFRFSGFSFDLGATLVFFIVAIVSLIESTGVYHALSEITGRKMERKDFRKGYTAEGLAIVLGSIFNAFPYTAYSQNVGLVSLSGAKKNNVIYGMVILLLICGCIPKLGALANMIPLPVLGGAMIAMFGMVMAYGVSILGKSDFNNQNNLLIIAIAVGLGAGINAVPEAFQALGDQFAWVTQNGIVIGTVAAIVLNFFFNGKQQAQSQVDQVEETKIEQK
ncbi:xanthine permease PbuX [Staphylococcus auricularis]|uniref:Xanthine permease n=1 Tax=Staphylococcus auricularis TaxID=29379 RepID=A0ABX5IEI2_9STAP|nr:nucleobase:cation symporter-2 family protein [Staphylococcus auricularis]MCE5039183.1 purine permease [Staphylococcus auricularis]MEB6570350.1 purine permease [Staphylococcus auricularis]PTH18106.1 xanthine permease [Staphylococcus auricularis]